MTEEEKDELLVRLDERVERIDKWCCNHDKHHFRYNIMAWSAAIGAIISLILLLCKGH